VVLDFPSSLLYLVPQFSGYPVLLRRFDPS
jgi:hypothetical protein